MITIRLVRLIAYYETHEFELIRYESRSITRNLSSPKEQTFKTEHIVLWFLNKSNLPILRKDREAFWEKLYPEIRELGIDVGTTKQFWIYIRKQKIPLKYQHSINQICSSVRHERIIVPYSDKLLRMLVSKLPQPLGKRLYHTTSVLRIYKYDVDE